MLNFIASDYGALEPFETSNAIRILRATYIVIITVMFLNILIAMLNLKIKQADKNAGNLYHLQMASLQVEIELGLISASERARRDWFPVWFSYSMTEAEKRAWKEYVDKNPLEWTQQNNFSENKDHAPPAEKEELEYEDQFASNAQEPAKPSSTSQVSGQSTKPSSGKDSGDAVVTTEIQQQQTADSVGTEQDLFTSYEPTNETQKAPAPGEEQEEDYVIHTCKICGQAGQLCTGCRLVAYCGRDHQRLDWNQHKRECKGKATSKK
jgi:hypothetical protein